MRISIWAIGKTDEKYLDEGIQKYINRLVHYTKVDLVTFKDVKPAPTTEETLKREAEMILSKIKTEDNLILLDEFGQMFRSVQFSAYIEKLQLQGIRHTIFLIGGAFGHHESIRARAQGSISLSKMTFSHQMVRLFFTEQLYRAFTIMRNEKYHND